MGYDRGQLCLVHYGMPGHARPRLWHTGERQSIGLGWKSALLGLVNGNCRHPMRFMDHRREVTWRTSLVSDS